MRYSSTSELGYWSLYRDHGQYKLDYIIVYLVSGDESMWEQHYHQHQYTWYKFSLRARSPRGGIIPVAAYQALQALLVKKKYSILRSIHQHTKYGSMLASPTICSALLLPNVMLYIKVERSPEEAINLRKKKNQPTSFVIM